MTVCPLDLSGNSLVKYSGRLTVLYLIGGNLTDKKKVNYMYIFSIIHTSSTHQCMYWYITCKCPEILLVRFKPSSKLWNFYMLGVLLPYQTFL